MENKMLEDLRKNSQDCVICKKPVLFNMSTIGLVSITESGKVVTPYEDNHGSMNVMMPLCAFHMVLAQEGMIAVTTENRVINVPILEDLETMSNKDIEKFLVKLNRMKKDQRAENSIRVSKAVLNARKFQEEMEKPLTEKEKQKLVSSKENVE